MYHLGEKGSHDVSLVFCSARCFSRIRRSKAMKKSDPWTRGEVIWVSIMVSFYLFLMAKNETLGIHKYAITFFFIVLYLLAKTIDFVCENYSQHTIWGSGMIGLVVLIVLAALASVGVHPLIVIILVGGLGLATWVFDKLGLL